MLSRAWSWARLADLRLRLDRRYRLVVTMMAVMPGVMLARPGIGIHASLDGRGLCRRDLGGLAGGCERRRGENRDCEQSRGNFLEHGRLLSGDLEVPGRMTGLLDHACDLGNATLNLR